MLPRISLTTSTLRTYAQSPVKKQGWCQSLHYRISNRDVLNKRTSADWGVRVKQRSGLLWRFTFYDRAVLKSVRGHYGTPSSLEEAITDLCSIRLDTERNRVKCWYQRHKTPIHRTKVTENMQIESLIETLTVLLSPFIIPKFTLSCISSTRGRYIYQIPRHQHVMFPRLQQDTRERHYALVTRSQ